MVTLMSKTRLLGIAALLATPLLAGPGRASTTSAIVFSADRAPSLSGEIYRVDPNGHRVNLTHSPSQDTRPAVSSDGKMVAFLSQRGNSVSVYEMGINGHGLVRIGPSLSPQGQFPYLAWQPHGNRVAFTGGGTVSSPRTGLWILQAGHKPLPVRGAEGGVRPSWSPDGRAVLVYSFNRRAAEVFSPNGRQLFTVPHAANFSSWSSGGLLAMATSAGLGVYDENGHRRFAASGQVSGGPAWSPDGHLVAAIVADKLEVLTQTGGVVLRKSLSGNHGVVWSGNTRVVLGAYGSCQCQAKSMDIRTGKISAASDLWFAPLSVDRTRAVETRKAGSQFALEVAPTAGGAAKTYAQVPGCYDDMVLGPAVDSVQFVGRSRSLLYASLCYEPFSQLYTVAPGGGTPRELPSASPYAIEPTLSPDGSQIAYSWARLTGLSCGGCPSQIRVANADGAGVRILTTPPDCTYDVSPTWSPDGRKLLYSQSDCNTAPELYTISAAGGSAQDLHIAGDDPAWGPSRIAYVDRDKSPGIWTANPDGSDPVRVASSGASPAWSVDGRLAYLSGKQGTTVVVGSTQVTLPFAQVTSLAWSPDGTRFVVTARTKDAPAPDVYTVKTDGTDPARLTTNYDASGVSWR
jgi:Tol biopolymer transport system component